MEFDDDYLELKDLKKVQKNVVRLFKVKSFDELKPVNKAIRKGEIAFINVQKLKEDSSMIELKRVVAKLKQVTDEVGGSLNACSANLICALPADAKFVKPLF